MPAANSVSAQDYADISNLYAFYNLSSDACDVEGYASCFTTDGVLDIVTIGFRRAGREELLRHKRDDAAGRAGRYRRHWNGGLHLERMADGSVQGRCYFVAYNGQPGNLPDLADAGTYCDRIVKVNDAWKFAERSLTLDGTTFKAPA